MIKITLDGLDQLIEYLEAITTPSWIDQALKDALPAIQKQASERYLTIAETTPYSIEYAYTPKPSGRYLYGDVNDPGYALDTLELFSDVTTPELQQGRIELGSDLSYASYQERLLRAKYGKGIAEFPSFFDDQGYADAVELAIANLFEGVNP